MRFHCKSATARCSFSLKCMIFGTGVLEVIVNQSG